MFSLGDWIAGITCLILLTGNAIAYWAKASSERRQTEADITANATAEASDRATLNNLAGALTSLTTSLREHVDAYHRHELAYEGFRTAMELKQAANTEAQTRILNSLENQQRQIANMVLGMSDRSLTITSTGSH